MKPKIPTLEIKMEIVVKHSVKNLVTLLHYKRKHPDEALDGCTINYKHLHELLKFTIIQSNQMVKLLRRNSNMLKKEPKTLGNLASSTERRPLCHCIIEKRKIGTKLTKIRGKQEAQASKRFQISTKEIQPRKSVRHHHPMRFDKLEALLQCSVPFHDVQSNL